MKIYSVYDEEFKQYGRVIEGYDFSSLEEIVLKREFGENGKFDAASNEDLESLPIAEVIQKEIFGETKIQIGCCGGHNDHMNGLEYHKSSELNYAVGEDMILLLAHRWQITDDWKLDTSLAKAFKVPAGTLVEMFATTMHYEPCAASKNGYRSIYILPAGTNFDLDEMPSDKEGENKLLLKKNKWMVAHAEGNIGPDAWIGLVGENVQIIPE